MEDNDLAQYNLNIILPNKNLASTKKSKKSNHKSSQNESNSNLIQIMTLPKETCLDLSQAVHESTQGFNIGAFSFRNFTTQNGKDVVDDVPLSDFTQVSNVLEKQRDDDKRLYVVLEDYNDIDVRHHVIRFREAAIGPSIQDSNNLGIESGLSIIDYIQPPNQSNDESNVNDFSIPDDHPFKSFDKNNIKPLSKSLPKQRGSELQQSVKSFSLSSWNPPPPQQRLKGHFLYLQLVTLEGEHFQITATRKGFHVNKSTYSSFDPSIKPSSEVTGGVSHSHSLFDLVSHLSPLHNSKFTPIFSDALNPLRDPFAIVQIPQALPANPWLASPPNHIADPLRTQSAYLLTGSTSLEGLEGARDWNDELQSTKQSPQISYHDRISREKLLQKFYADFSLAAIRGVIAIYRGEIPPINPLEDKSKQVYSHANILYSPSISGLNEEAELSRVKIGKEIAYHKILNTIDAPGIYNLASVAVDYAGKRYLAQSIIPGLLRKFELENEAKDTENEKNENESENDNDNDLIVNEVIYGVDEINSPIKKGKNDDNKVNIKFDKKFSELLQPISRSLRISNKKVKIDENEYEFPTSVQLKGLIGADGKRYIIEPSRLSYVDINFIEKDLKQPLREDLVEENVKSNEINGVAYPHSQILLRQEAIEAYSEFELRRRSRDAVERARNEGIEKGIFPKPTQQQQIQNKDNGENENEKKDENVVLPPSSADIEKAINEGKISVPQIGSLTFNSDAFLNGENYDENDESVKSVRAASSYIRDTLIPLLVLDVVHGNNIPADGSALTSAMHQKGINMRYLGSIIESANVHRNRKSIVGPAFGAIDCFKNVVKHEMVFRASKHILRNYLTQINDVTLIQPLISHFLNCLLGTSLESNPKPVVPKDDFDNEIMTESDKKSSEWFNLNPTSLRNKIIGEISKRFRFNLSESFFDLEIRKPQLLRELALRVGFQLDLRDYRFDNKYDEIQDNEIDSKVVNDNTLSKKAIKKAKAQAQAQSRALSGIDRSTTFIPSDIIEIVPLVKDSGSRSSICDDAFEHGRLAFQTGAAGFANMNGPQSIVANREAGLELMYEGVSLFEQVYTPLHAEVAKAFNGYVVAKHQMIKATSTLESMNNEKESKENENNENNEKEQKSKEEKELEKEQNESLEHEQCLKLQRNAVIISERTLGIDHHETLSFIQNLAFLEISAGNVMNSLNYFKYAIELWNRIYGNNHPEILQLYSSIGSIFQQSRRFEDSLRMFELAKELSVEIYGTNSYFTASMLLRIAEQHVCVNQLKLKPAINACKEAVKAYEESIGKEAQEYKEAQTFLNQLTAAAVHIAKSNSDPIQQNAKKLIRQRQLQQDLQQKQIQQQSQQQKQKNENVNGNNTNAPTEDDVDAMVRFIQGNDGNNKKNKKGNKKSKK